MGSCSRTRRIVRSAGYRIGRRTPWDRTRKRVGLDGVRLHDLRHFQATMLLQAGVAENNISKRIGHRDTATTLDDPSQFLKSADREAADVIGRLLPSRAVEVTTHSDELSAGRPGQRASAFAGGRLNSLVANCDGSSSDRSICRRGNLISAPILIGATGSCPESSIR